LKKGLSNIPNLESKLVMRLTCPHLVSFYVKVKNIVKISPLLLISKPRESLTFKS